MYFIFFGTPFDRTLENKLKKMDTLKNIIYAGVGLASTTSEKIKETINELVEKGKISDTEGKKIIDDFLNSTEDKRAEFEIKLKKTGEKISERFDFLNKEKEVDSLKARIEELEGQITNMKKKTSTTTKKSKTKTTKK
jgi:polyhydroxyalkanoate synthesis regulator phasin